MSNWIKALQKARLKSAETPPEGWLPIEAVAKDMGCLPAYAHRTVTALIAAGRADRQKFRVQCGSLVREKFHYKLK